MPKPGPLGRDHVAARARCRREVARDDQAAAAERVHLLAPPRATGRPCGRRRAPPGPRGCRRPSPCSSSGSTRERMVGAVHRAVEREVLLDERGAQRGGGDRDRDAERVVRQPDGDAERALHRVHRAQVDALRRAPDRPTCTASGRRRARRRRARRSSASSISPKTAMPVEMISGRPVDAALRISSQVDDLERGDLQHRARRARRADRRRRRRTAWRRSAARARGRRRRAPAATRAGARSPRATRTATCR